MTEKEEIRNNPWKVYITSQRYYTTLKIPKLYIEIELTDEDENLFLYKESFGKTKRGINIEKNVHNYDEDGRDFFSELVPTFGNVWVFIHGEKQPWHFRSYEEFLDKITSD